MKSLQKCHLGLLDDGNGPVFQGLHGRFGVFFGQGGADDGRDGMLGHDLLEEREIGRAHV